MCIYIYMVLVAVVCGFFECGRGWPEKEEAEQGGGLGIRTIDADAVPLVSVGEDGRGIRDG